MTSEKHLIFKIFDVVYMAKTVVTSIEMASFGTTRKREKYIFFKLRRNPGKDVQWAIEALFSRNRLLCLHFNQRASQEFPRQKSIAEFSGKKSVHGAAPHPSRSLITLALFRRNNGLGHHESE